MKKVKITKKLLNRRDLKELSDNWISNGDWAMHPEFCENPYKSERISIKSRQLPQSGSSAVRLDLEINGVIPYVSGDRERVVWLSVEYDRIVVGWDRIEIAGDAVIAYYDDTVIAIVMTTRQDDYLGLGLDLMKIDTLRLKK